MWNLLAAAVPDIFACYINPEEHPLNNFQVKVLYRSFNSTQRAKENMCELFSKCVLILNVGRSKLVCW